jgi:multicomponent Na+:H+ antiporter subunit A
VTALLLAHLVVGVGIVAAGPAARRWAIPAAALPMLATVAWLAVVLPEVVDGDVRTEQVSWIPALDVFVDLRLDGFGALMLLLVAGIGVLVVTYAASYFHDPGADTARLMGLLTLFAGAMAGVVLADNLLVLYGFWELTSVTSFLLIGNQHRDIAARAAALQALLVTGLGALAMLTGFIVLGEAAGTYRLSAVLADPPGGGGVTVALLLVLLGAFTKSAQYPFHSWLPAAMVAPTPVSAYLHSATMVKAGVYLVARLAPVFAVVGVWRPLVVVVGLVTMIGGGLRALRQSDLKLLLAMGTISQLGFMMVVLGWGDAETATAGAVVLLGHGAFKAAAFMVVGILDHQHGTRDVRDLPRPASGWAPVTVVAVVAAASMAGLPLLFGFIGKEADFEALYDAGASGRLTLAFVVVGSVLTAAYSLRFVRGVTGRLASAPTDTIEGSAPGMWFVAPGAVLAAVTVLLGLWPALADGLVTAATVALVGPIEPVHLAIWHGLTVPLELSALALALGAVVGLSDRFVPRVLALGAALPTASGGYRTTLLVVNRVANRVTRIAQPGSLPIYLGVILVTAVAVPGAALLTGTWWPGWPDVAGTPAQVAVLALVLGFGFAAAAVHRRFSAALFLGMAGYAMAGVFLVQGAPDLALTQVAIETLTTVLFVLVLRRLPDRFETRGAAEQRAVRRVVAVGIGALVFCFTLAVGAEQPSTDVSDAMIELAYPEAEGRNVVNVILVDIRGYDTLGEITVLAAGAIGTVALARAGRRRAPHAPGDGAATDPGERLPPPVPLARMVSIEVSVRIVFAAVLVGSLWLLFAGHNQPGGGFAGGIVAGAAVALRYVSGGIDDVRRLSRGKPWLVLGSGLLIAVVVALVPVLLGESMLETTAWTFDLPLLGTVKVTSALFFDIGVYLAVIGLALMVFESFGDDAPLPAGGGVR